MSTPLHVFVVAGEHSGDLLGGRLMAALKRRAGEGGIRFSGVGGPRMEAQGLSSLFPMTDLAVFGLAELLPRIPHILRRLRETEASIRAEKPDVVVTIDAPDFNFRLAKRLQGSGIPIVHYVAPTVWAWRAGRAQKIQPLFRHLLALFPFEPPYFEKVGLPCTFVGHPLVEAGIEQIAPMALKSPSLLLLPGSRRSEVGALLPVFKEVLLGLKERFGCLDVVVPTVPHLHDTVAEALADIGLPVRLVTDEQEKYAAMRGVTAALAASGTVALELGLADCPAVIAYKIHPLTFLLYRRMIKVKYANLINIMADRLVVPECLQDNCTATQILAQLVPLLSSEEVRMAQKAELVRVAAKLSARPDVSPSDMAAGVILNVASRCASGA